MPERTAPPTTPLPGALAQQRLALDELLAAKLRPMLAGQANGAPDTDGSLARLADDAQIVDAQVRHFAEQVERENDSRQRVAGAGHPVLDYAEAVLIEGERGPLVVGLTEYDATPAYWQASAGGHIDTLIVGADLVAFLRGDGDDAARRGAEQLGLG